MQLSMATPREATTWHCDTDESVKTLTNPDTYLRTQRGGKSGDTKARKLAPVQSKMP